MLVVTAKRDALCPYPAAQAAQLKAQNASLLTFDCLHFDIYNAPWFQQAVDEEMKFMLKFGV
jgi:fermentation-respiration switch protein FrsA (DUF1100 family)